MSSQTYLIAHRGASVIETENTIAAVEKAIEHKADAIELDVRGKDDDLIVFHDATVDRLMIGKGALADHTLDSLRSLRFKSGEGRIPLLSEVLEVAKDRTSLILELKEYGLIPRLKGLLRTLGSWAREEITVSSFLHSEIEEARRELPHVNIGALFYGVPAGLEASIEKVKPQSVHIDFSSITESVVGRVHAMTLPLYTYTANDDRAFRRVTELGIDGIFTDDIGAARRHFRPALTEGR
jgi:glycerophosphoryl diester phosphodiesterase